MIPPRHHNFGSLPIATLFRFEGDVWRKVNYHEARRHDGPDHLPPVEFNYALPVAVVGRAASWQ